MSQKFDPEAVGSWISRTIEKANEDGRVVHIYSDYSLTEVLPDEKEGLRPTNTLTQIVINVSGDRR